MSESTPSDPAPSSAAPSGPRPGRRRRRKRRSGGAAGSPGGAEPLEQRAARALAELAAVARLVAERHHAPLPDTLDLQLPLNGAPPGGHGFVDTVRAAAEAARPDDAVWRPGHVYCFQCGAPDCRHARPADARALFVGYAPTGKPQWLDFVEAAVARRVDGVERLYHRPPGVVAWAETDALTDELLPGFGRGRGPYRVLGQAAVGLVPADLRSPDADRVALTLQIVETQRPQTPVQLRLNILGLASESVIAAAADGAPHGPAERLRRLIEQARRRLGVFTRRAVTAQARGEAYDVEQAARGLLGPLRGDLVRVFDADARRTQHAQTRREEGARPTATVWRDARQAGDDRIFKDAHHGTLVVVGPRGRAHVFTAEARHVTSLRLGPGELERRTTKGRWTLPPPHLVRGFREHLKASADAREALA